MQFATLLFYAVASLFLGVIATQNSGAISVALGQPANLQSPVVTGLIVLTIASSLVFAGLAVLAVLRGDFAPGVTPPAPKPPKDPDEAVILDALRDLNEPYPSRDR